jgi:carboxymethylenebutenolidase
MSDVHPVPPSRRQVLAGTIGTGFALAVRPVAASTIITSGEGLDAADVKIPGEGGPIPGYRAVAAHRKGKAPVVIVVHEIFGLHEHIKDVCRRFAKEGYLAVAPDLFARQGDATKLTDFKEIQEKIVSRVSDAQVRGDLDATAAWVKGDHAADPARLGLTGFCWGGRHVWLYAAHSPSVKAAVAWYGRLTGPKDAMHPEHPLDVAATLKAPVEGLYGAQDQAIPLSSVEEMRKALAAGGPAAKRSTITVFPDAGHAFHADYRPTYRPQAAAEGWKRALAWFRENGVG